MKSSKRSKVKAIRHGELSAKKLPVAMSNNPNRYYPTFTPEIPAIGSNVDMGVMPGSIPGTFMDLLNPDTSYNEERKKILESTNEAGAKKGRTRFNRGNPVNYYALTAMMHSYFAQLIRHLNYALEPVNAKIPNITRAGAVEAVWTYAGSMASSLAVKREGNAFLVRIPIGSFRLGELLELAKRPDEPSTGLTVHGEQLTDEEHLERAGFDPVALKFGFNFASEFRTRMNSRKNAFPMDELIEAKGRPIKIEMPTLNPGYPKFKQFYENPKYMQGIELETPAIAFQSTDKQTIERFLTNLVRVTATVRLPIDEAQYYVQKPAAQIKAVDIMFFFNNWVRNGLRAQGRSPFPSYTYTYDKIQQKSVGFPLKDRRDKYGLLLDKNNVVSWLPAAHNSYQDYLEQYTQGASVEGDPENLSLRDANLPGAKLLFVDWINEKLVYTGVQSQILTMDLSESYPVLPSAFFSSLVSDSGWKYLTLVDPVYEAMKSSGKFSDMPMFSIDSNSMSALETRLLEIEPVAAQIALVHGSEKQRGGFSWYFRMLVVFLNEANKSTRNGLPDWVDKAPTIKNMWELRNIDLFAPIQFIEHFANYVFRSEEFTLKVINNSGMNPREIMNYLGGLKIVSQITNFDEIYNESVKQTAPYRDKTPVDMATPVDAPNMENVSGFMYHQARSIKLLDRDPTFAVIRVDAGGGKTIIAITDIMKSLAKGTVKRPLVLCPNNLIKDYVKEANFVSGGKINVIPLDGTVFRNYANIPADKKTGQKETWDYSRLDNLLRNAPPNTIVVMGYDVISQATTNKVTNVYGNSVFETFSHLEFMANVGFDGVWCDESHYLKGSAGGESLRLYVNRFLISRIPIRRLMTGTFATNTLVDFVKQMELFNPSILGTETQFRQTYDQKGRTSGTFSPRISDDGSDATLEIYNIINRNCTFINVDRKEWAAFLPPMAEEVVLADLTENQREAYSFLIEKAVDELEEEMSREQIQIMQEDTEDNSVTSDSTEIDELFDSFQNNLHAVEAFLASPTSIPEVRRFLKTKADKQSPKGLTVNLILDERLPVSPGKTLIFCNTHAAVEGVYNALEAKYKDQTILYKANRKAECEQQFNTDPSKRIMIGVSSSMDTGLNLQVADTLIRIDTVWTPGKLEQGNARINRPNLKVKVDPRMESGIVCYYVTVDRTIDTVKFAKLASKTVAIARFNSHGTGDARFDQIGIDPETGKLIEPLRLGFDILRKGLSRQELHTHLGAYSELRDLEQTINREYAAEHPEMRERFALKHTGNLKGSKILRQVPYVAGATIANADQLNLIPYLQYRQDRIAKFPDEEFDPAGLAIHTEFGDGICERETNTTIRIRFDDGSYVDNEKMTSFVITKMITSPMEIRDSLAAVTGLDQEDLNLKSFKADQIDQKAAERRRRQDEADARRAAQAERRARKQQEENEKQALQTKEREAKRAQKLQQEADREKRRLQREAERQAAEERKARLKGRVRGIDATKNVRRDSFIKDHDVPEQPAYHMEFGLVNGMIAATIHSEDPKQDLKTFRKFGFRITKPYLETEFKYKKSLVDWLDWMYSQIEKNKIDIPQDIWTDWETLEDEFSQGRSKILRVAPYPKAQIDRWVRTSNRRVTNPLVARIVPIIEQVGDKPRLYASIDADTHRPALLQMLRRYRKDGVNWVMKEPALRAYFPTKTTARAALVAMEKAGIKFADKKAVIKGFNDLKMKAGRKKKS